MSNTAVKTTSPEVQKATPVQQRRPIFTPQVDILEVPEELVLMIDMPGVKPDDVEIHFERGELTVHGKRQQPSERKGQCLVEEVLMGDYYRAFLVGLDLAVDKITAEMKNGVLTVHLPRLESALPRRISVKS
jgi:HSP20 family protein